MGEARWLLEVDRRRCIGSGVCASVYPGRFVISGGRSRPAGPETEPDDELLDAAEMCPMGAIRVTEAGTGAVLAPEE